MNEWRTLACAVLVAAGVAAAVAAATVRLAADERPRIAGVRLAELAAEHAAEAARGNATPEETAGSVRVWAFALEAALDDIAVRGNVVLLPARAVAAGAPDLTDEVRQAVGRMMERERAGAEDRP